MTLKISKAHWYDSLGDQVNLKASITLKIMFGAEENERLIKFRYLI